MSCEKYIVFLDEYLNDELNEKLRGAVGGHLDDCAACRKEIQLLSFETAFYEKAAKTPERDSDLPWSAIRGRLVAESLISDERSAAPNAGNSLITVFFASLKDLFSAKIPVFGSLLLIVLGLATLFLLNQNKNEAENKTIAGIATPENSSFGNTFNPPENNGLQSIPGGSSEQKPAENIFQKTRPVKIRSAVSRVNAKNYGKVISRDNRLEKTANATVTPAAARQPREKMDGNLSVAAAENDEKLANYLNKIHLFLLMFRNLDSDETINAVLGEKYQTEAQTFLDNNNNYKKVALRAKNIPAVELLNEIEPVLQAISKLGERNAGDRVGSAATMVKQSGVVFKIRLWVSAAKAERIL